MTMGIGAPTADRTGVASKGSNVNLLNLEPAWPVAQGREEDLYFYLEAIEEYLPGNRVRVVGYGDMIMLGGYSYLGLIGHPAINEAAHRAIDRFGTGTHGVRMLAGTLVLHRELEARIAPGGAAASRAAKSPTLKSSLSGPLSSTI